MHACAPSLARVLPKPSSRNHENQITKAPVCACVQSTLTITNEIRDDQVQAAPVMDALRRLGLRFTPRVSGVIGY